MASKAAGCDSDRGERSRLLVVSPGGLGKQYHGPAISIYRLLSRLEDRLHVDVLHGSVEQDDMAPLKGRAIRTGTATSHFQGSFSYLIGASWFMFRHHRDYDVVLLASLNLLTLIPGVIAHMLGIRVVARAAAIAEVSTQTGGSLGSALKLALMRRVSVYLAISGRIKAGLEEVAGGEGSVHHIPNGVDTARFAPVDHGRAAQLTQELELKPAPLLRLICVGAMGNRKGQHILVEAMSLLPEGVALLLVGPYREQGYRQEITNLISKKGLEGRVDHIEFMHDVEKAYGTGAVYLLPSAGEGMPNGMLEAMACGLVPIGTRVSGIEDLIQPGCGRFVERDARSIADAVQAYIRDPEKLAKERNRARSRIEAAYSSALVSERFFHLLTKGINNSL
ncbi:glycosyltransferase family 4 protein [Qipengyuania sp. 1XM1-15A]|uniref:glycosyltransferase family 4 protein n=1 Tax=Qipengyuania xiamenensis TaxID=2867237 RepID=UPI001C86FBD7|nr:glycosyltransferase family 4 protein [Qipengyuania xiamenensis]MBX7531767.1 glycosyltransferase family 4 protein [Qipengyuania xiamenensis]